MVIDRPVILITGTSRGIGRHLVGHFVDRGFEVVGCSRADFENPPNGYHHHCLDVTDEKAVLDLFKSVRRQFGRLDALVNNAGIASMNHGLLTPVKTIESVLGTNVVGTFLFCREAAKLMQMRREGRIVNFATVATPMRLEGEAAYAASKAAVVSLTEILARELAEFGITVNAVGPTPIKTDLIRSVPEEKIASLIKRQAIKRFGELDDVSNVIDFFLRPETNFVTGQVIYLGGL